MCTVKLQPCRLKMSVSLKDAFLVFHLDLHLHFNKPLKSLEQELVIKKTTFVAIKQLESLMKAIKNVFCVRKRGWCHQ